VFVSGRVGNSLVISLLMVVLIAALGKLVYDVSLPDQTIPALLVTLAVGAFAFSCLGFALTTIISNEDAAPAVTNAIVLPLYFISGVFVPDSEDPGGRPACRRRVSRPPVLPGVLHHLGPEHHRRGL
jgi:ABC-2 type transport system permease protein